MPDWEDSDEQFDPVSAYFMLNYIGAKSIHLDEIVAMKRTN
jgi:hypothetical protein